VLVVVFIIFAFCEIVFKGGEYRVGSNHFRWFPVIRNLTLGFIRLEGMMEPQKRKSIFICQRIRGKQKPCLFVPVETNFLPEVIG